MNVYLDNKQYRDMQRITLVKNSDKIIKVIPDIK